MIKRFIRHVIRKFSVFTAIAGKITIHDVALAAGVSISTVSLMLSGRGRISSAAGKRVNAAIEQLRFVRNRQTSALRGGQSGVIGLIVHDLSTLFCAELTASLTEALGAQGRMVFLLHGSRGDEQLTQCFAMLLNQGVNGVVITGVADSNDDLRQLTADKGIPIVFASRASYLDDIDTVGPDNMQAAQLLVEYLMHHGHRRIAWLGGQNSSLTHAERVDGYCTTLLKYGLPSHSDWALECSSSQKQTAEEVAALLHRNPTVSAVVCYNEIIAVGARFGLMRAGRQSSETGVDRYLEQQILLAGFADAAENALDNIPIIWACTLAHEVGYTLAEHILQRIGHNDGHSCSLTLSTRLVVAK